MTVLTLTTDFGLTNGYVGVMKGVIYSIAPDVSIVDITHLIPPQDVRTAALTLMAAVDYFPAGTVHVVVVDPGVGTTRRPIAARIGEHFYVAPDNGVLALLYERAEQDGQERLIVHLDKSEYYLPTVSTTFHGRDIFAPCGAYLAAGVQLGEIGTPISDPQRLEFPQPVRTRSGLRGEIMLSDHFGNLATNIRAGHLGHALDKKSEICINVCGVDIMGLVDTFAERPPGECVGLINSEGYLEISVVNGHAAKQLNARIGDPVEVVLP